MDKDYTEKWSCSFTKSGLIYKGNLKLYPENIIFECAFPKLQIVMQFVDIVEIKKKKTVVFIDDSIEMSLNDGSNYLFSGFSKRGNVFDVLMQNWQEYDTTDIVEDISLDYTINPSDEEFEQEGNVTNEYSDDVLMNEPGVSVNLDTDGGDIDLPVANCVHYEEKQYRNKNQYTINMNLYDYYKSWMEPQFQRAYLDIDCWDVVVPDWELSEENCCYVREVCNTMPLNFPIGPSSTGVIQTQRMFRPQENQIVLFFETRTLDVPLGEDFLVNGFWVATETNGSVVLDISLDIEWLKVSWSAGMIKGQIDKKSIEEGEKKSAKMLQFIQEWNNVSSEAPAEKKVGRKRIMKKKKEVDMYEKLFQNIKYVSIFFVIFFGILAVQTSIQLYTRLSALQLEVTKRHQINENIMREKERLYRLEKFIEKLGKEKYQEFPTIEDEFHYWKSNQVLSTHLNDLLQHISSTNTAITKDTITTNNGQTPYRALTQDQFHLIESIFYNRSHSYLTTLLYTILITTATLAFKNQEKLMSLTSSRLIN